jgi:deoxyribose-phosphate aldolase
MDKKLIFEKVDHTLLTQTATWEEIKEICDDAIASGVASAVFHRPM